MKTAEQIALIVIDRNYAKIDNDYQGMDGLAASLAKGETTAGDLLYFLQEAVRVDRELAIQDMEDLKDKSYPPFPGAQWYNGALHNAQEVLR